MLTLLVLNIASVGNGLVGSMMDIIIKKTSNESANIMGSVATALKGPKLDVMKLNLEEVRTNVVAGAMSESASLRPPLREYVDRLKLETLGETEQLGWVAGLRKGRWKRLACEGMVFDMGNGYVASKGKRQEGGREVLQKLVIQSIPVYSMNPFHLPRDLIEKLHGHCAKFW
ncbi:hypothetical protein ACOSQ4_025440 [Xanthoceras sorbifolium]